MRVVLDTNVIVSGVFFGGVPAVIIQFWRNRRFELVTTAAIREEYVFALHAIRPELADNYSEILDLMASRGHLVEDRPVNVPLCRDPDDDKFLACAAASDSILVSGDKDLLAADGALGVKVLTPRAFLTLLERHS